MPFIYFWGLRGVGCLPGCAARATLVLLPHAIWPQSSSLGTRAWGHLERRLRNATHSQTLCLLTSCASANGRWVCVICWSCVANLGTHLRPDSRAANQMSGHMDWNQHSSLVHTPRRHPPADSLILFKESLSLPTMKLKFHPRHPWRTTPAFTS